MKSKTILAAYIIMALTVFSCKKEDPQTVASSLQSPTAIFSFSGMINGEAITLQAGVNDYIVHPSYAIDDNRILEFTSEFKNLNCANTNCPNSLKIRLKGNAPLSDAQFSIDNSITTAYYSFASPLGTPSQYLQYYSGGTSSLKAKNYIWDFGDGTASISSSLSTMAHTYKRPGIYYTTLTIEDSTACISSMSHRIKIGQTGNAFIANYAPIIKGDTAIFSPITIGGTAPYTYLWDFGDGATSTEISPIHLYNIAGVYTTALTMTDATGYTDTYNYTIHTNNPTNCVTYLYPTTNQAIANPTNLSTVIIEWTDANGILWTSFDNKQTAEKSLFNITKIENYVADTEGRPTKKIQAIITCKLYNGANSILLQNANLSFTVAYK
jgi:PKD repeat protein